MSSPDKAQEIHNGSHVLAKDAFGKWHRMAAVSGVEPTHENGRKIHDFPIVWVTNARLASAGEKIPWPAEDVRLAPPSVPDRWPRYDEHGWRIDYADE